MPSDRQDFRSRLTAAGAAAAVLVTLTGSAVLAHPGGWKSGVRGNRDAPGFASWRGTPLDVAVGFIQWKNNGWAEMTSYAGGSDVRRLRSYSPNVSLGHALFPKGGSLAACASGSYDDEHREIARRLVANGVGDAEIRLGWESNGDWFPWSIKWSSVSQWRDCFVRVARVFKSQSAAFRIAWSMNKKGRGDVRTAWDAEVGSVVTNICISHYDDPWDRFGHETFMGGPWGLEAWADFARARGKKFCLGEWGVGREGDNPTYVQQMHDFLERNAGTIAHEAYFNSTGTANFRFHPSTRVPKSAAHYRELF
jgi:hypothetical protein